MAAPRASIAVSVTRAGLTLATAFALTRVFAGRSWLFVMVLAAVVPPAVPRRGRSAGTGTRSSGSRSSAVVRRRGSRRSSPTRRRTVAGVPTRRDGRRRSAHALGRAPHTLRAAVVPGLADRVGARARVRRRVRRGRAHVLDRDLARRAGRRVRAEHRAVHRRRRDRRAAAGSRPPRCTRSPRSATCSRSRSTTSSTRRTWFHASRPRGSRRRGRRRARSARSRS